MNIPIPPAALEAGARALREEVRRALNVVEPDPPEGPSPSLMEAYGNEARAAFVAMVAEWPGMDTIMLPRMMQPGHFVPQDYIRLPLTEKQDDRP